MYYPYFIAYMASGFVISIVVFFWALNNGQFKDQQRARFIPLENDLKRNPVKAKVSRFARIEITALFSLVCICLACSVAVVVFALMKAAK
jgi:cbb3-type cytochrome oxidase maturation protein